MRRPRSAPTGGVKRKTSAAVPSPKTPSARRTSKSKRKKPSMSDDEQSSAEVDLEDDADGEYTGETRKPRASAAKARAKNYSLVTAAEDEDDEVKLVSPKLERVEQKSVAMKAEEVEQDIEKAASISDGSADTKSALGKRERSFGLSEEVDEQPEPEDDDSDLKSDGGISPRTRVDESSTGPVLERTVNHPSYL